MNTNQEHYDIVIVGGGIIGSALALALAQAEFLVLVIDPILPIPIAENMIPDLRVSAINCTSVAFLRRIQAWQRIDNRFCIPYRRLETWEWLSSKVTFEADSLNLKELGFIVENRRLKQALWQGFTNCSRLALRCPAVVNTMTYKSGFWWLTLNDNSTVTSRIVIGADGTKSWIRRHAGIANSGWQYRQSCLLLSVKTEAEQQDVVWQAFYPSGPRAFLPLYEQWAILVWYDHVMRIRQLEKLSFSILKREVELAFPKRLCISALCSAASFSLERQHASKYVKSGLALVGDAAHTINPLAGQGANLGFRDAEALAEVLIKAYYRDESWDTLSVLQRYQRCRRSDNLLMQASIDVLYTVFSNNLLPLVLARNFGFMLVERVSSIKRQVLRYALGL